MDYCKMSVRWIYAVLAWLLIATREGAAYMSGFDPVTDLSSSALEATDEVSLEVPLTEPFPFYNRKYDSIFVNDDGILTLGAPLPASLPGPVALPMGDVDFSGDANLDREKAVVIAPLWSEVNTADSSSAGTVYYRVGLTRNSQAVQNAETMVKSCYINQEGFTATAGAVFTWDKVSDVPDGNVQPNSFQAILVYDSLRSFVIFYYSELNYLSSTVTGGTQVGFNAGDVWGGFSYPYPNNDFQKLVDNTNCEAANENGAYVFRVDTEIMTSPGCSVNQGFYASQVWPTSGPMMGGNRISLAPTCGLGVTTANCVFKQGDTVLQVATEQQIVGTVLVCIPSPFFVTGDVSILVYRIGDDTDVPDDAVYTHKYTVEHPDDSTVTVDRASSTSSSWTTAGSPLTITWLQSLFNKPSTLPTTANPGAENLRISVMQYDEAVANQEPTWKDVYDLGTNIPNTGRFSFTPGPLENITQDNPWGVIRVQRMDGYPVALYSDAHMLGYLLDQDYQDDPTQWADAECKRWDVEEDKSNDNDDLPSYLANVPPCPCTLEQALIDTSHFMRQRGGCAINADYQSCTRQGDSRRTCFMSVGSASGAECCYDVDNSNLVFSLDDRTGGSSDKAAMLGVPPYGLPGRTPYFSHWTVDVMPYQVCCRWGDDDACRLYLENRRPKGCADYGERQSGFIFGDPHFITFDQRRYTFNGIGEYRMMEVSGPEFKLFGRTTVATDNLKEDAPVASFLNAVVMQETGSDIVHVELGNLRSLNLYVHQGNAFTQPDLFLNTDIEYDPLYLKGVTVFVNSQFSRILVAFQTSKILVDVAAWTQGISAEVIALKTDFPASAIVTGLLGDMDNDPDNDIRQVNNAVYTGDDPQQIFDVVKEWVTTSASEPSFHYDGKTKHKNYQNTTFVPVLVTPDSSTLDPAIAPLLETTCKGLEECIYDMSVTQTVVAGQNCYTENLEYEERRDQVLAKIETCAYIPSPAKGKVEYSNPSEKYAVGTSITFSCVDTKSILIGPSTRTCETSESGPTWSDATMPECSETNCNTDEVGGADVISTSYVDGNLQVVFGCPGTSVRYTLTCIGGSWEGARIDCLAGAGGLSGGAIAGIVIGSLVGVALIVLVVVFFLRRGGFGEKDLEQSGTKVNAPAENWGMEEEGKNASASLGGVAGHASEV
ncbi:sushi domain-containing protein 2-like isoform X2 [Patiria miniata]|uniref:Uncharacterized protein n=1 Tax=Patiria miniata TaxID=46514 RepID=A0A914APX1_PATMI|nr:sushi domain-containing protein 2-like isoform X2 [Patiria miniata]